MNDLHGKRRNIDFLSDAEIIEIAKRVGLPIVHIPCDTAEGSFVATVDLMKRPPIVTRKRDDPITW